MKTLTSLAIAASLFAITSCSKEPKACFKVEVQTNDGKWVPTTTGKVGELFFFSPLCSKNAFASGTMFDYGDGTTGTEESHEYKKPGNYTVKCTIYAPEKGEKGTKSDIASQAVVVKDLQADATRK